MKTSLENIAKFIATAIMADGNYDEAEKIALEEIADALELDANALTASVETEISTLSSLSEAKKKEYLCVASTEVAENENNILFEALLEIVLVDGILAAEEVETLFTVANLLAIPQTDAVLMLADMVKEEPELTIKF